MYNLTMQEGAIFVVFIYQSLQIFLFPPTFLFHFAEGHPFRNPSHRVPALHGEGLLFHSCSSFVAAVGGVGAHLAWPAPVQGVVVRVSRGGGSMAF